MATTPRLTKGDRIPNQLKAEIGRLSAQGLSVPKIVEEIAKFHGLLISFEAAQRWTLRVRQGLKVDPKGTREI